MLPFLLAAVVVGVAKVGVVWSHGRLVDPPSRSTMWREGFKNPPNYNDHELFCGGLQRMIANGNRCGICGDPYDAPKPRPNEAGGIYANGILVRTYRMNQVLEATVELTAHHRGYFEFKICPVSNPKEDPSQECFDSNRLHLVDSPGTKHYVPRPSPDRKYRVRLRLPKWLRCSFCVLQWTYTAGNNWGACADGAHRLGCGTQETFRACADVAVKGQGAFEKLVHEGLDEQGAGALNNHTAAHAGGANNSATTTPSWCIVALLLCVILFFYQQRHDDDVIIHA